VNLTRRTREFCARAPSYSVGQSSQMNSATSLNGQHLSPSLTLSVRDEPFNAHLESLRELVGSLLNELDSLGRLMPRSANPVHLREAVQTFEMDLISAALVRTRGNQAQAARLLGVKHTTLNAKVKRYHIR